MRDAVSRYDPPVIPYLGIYLSDLTYIDEGTPNFKEKGLLNFAKMRMVRILRQKLLKSFYKKLSLDRARHS